MAYSYSGNPATSDCDKYRFLTGDTGEAESFIMTDDEVQYIIDTYDVHNARMYFLFQSMVNKLAMYYKRSLGPQSEDPTSRLEHFKSQAKDYRTKMVSTNLSLPVYEADKSFKKGIHDNV